MIFEALMLICFGAAWPFSIWKSYTSRRNEGKSLKFMIIVEIGYLSGVIYKVFYNFDAVLYLYLLNILFVAADMTFYFRNAVLARRNFAGVSSTGGENHPEPELLSPAR